MRGVPRGTAIFHVEECTSRSWVGALSARNGSGLLWLSHARANQCLASLTPAGRQTVSALGSCRRNPALAVGLHDAAAHQHVGLGCYGLVQDIVELAQLIAAGLLCHENRSRG